jgi:hypothetical protein
MVIPHGRISGSSANQTSASKITCFSTSANNLGFSLRHEIEFLNHYERGGGSMRKSETQGIHYFDLNDWPKAEQKLLNEPGNSITGQKGSMNIRGSSVIDINYGFYTVRLFFST